MVLIGYFKSANVMPKEKEYLPGWKMMWLASGNKLIGYVMVTNGAITKDKLGEVELDVRGYDADELKAIETRTLKLRDKWEW